mmetsp:Transcript_13326/g.32699  ORF Transcript_13326/g.32699 Transcript_13326/m.32699 type:complete len:229 (-) Transcript_13326:227-913(-)
MSSSLSLSRSPWCESAASRTLSGRAGPYTALGGAASCTPTWPLPTDFRLASSMATLAGMNSGSSSAVPLAANKPPTSPERQAAAALLPPSTGSCSGPGLSAVSMAAGAAGLSNSTYPDSEAAAEGLGNSASAGAGVGGWDGSASTSPLRTFIARLRSFLASAGEKFIPTRSSIESSGSVVPFSLCLPRSLRARSDAPSALASSPRRMLAQSSGDSMSALSIANSPDPR